MTQHRKHRGMASQRIVTTILIGIVAIALLAVGCAP